ncbi:hypothetical protein ACFSQ7_12825 [Paenibacillus rhizoplanae]
MRGVIAWTPSGRDRIAIASWPWSVSSRMAVFTAISLSSSRLWVVIPSTSRSMNTSGYSASINRV